MLLLVADSWLVALGAVGAGAVLAGFCVEAAFWSVLDGVVLIADWLLDGMLWLDAAADWSAGVVLEAPLAAALPPLQESEIMLTEVTCSDPPDCVPCTST